MNDRFTRIVHNVVSSLVPVVCPGGGEELRDAIVNHTLLSFASAPRPIRTAITAGVTAYEVGAFVYPQVAIRPASLLNLDDHKRYFRWWAESPIAPNREFAKAMKGFICLAYYEHPTTQSRIGYTPAAWVKKVRDRRLRTYASEIDAHRHSVSAVDPLPSTIPGYGDGPSATERSAAL